MRRIHPNAASVRAAAIALLLVAATAGAGRQDRYAPREWESITVTRFVRSVAVGPRYVGLGTEGGLLFYDRLSDRWRIPVTVADGLPESSVRAVSFTPDGRFVVQTRREIGRVEPATGRYMPDPFARPPAPSAPGGLPLNLFAGPEYQYLTDGRILGPLGVYAPILAAAEDDQAGLWMATWGLGAGRADLRTLSLEMKPHGLWSSDVRALAVGADWLMAGGLGDAASTGGITEWRMSADNWEYILATDTPGLRTDRIFDLAVDGSVVWAALESGVARRDAGGGWRTWTRRDGLPDERITSVAVGAGAVWAGSFRGSVAMVSDTLYALAIPPAGAVRDIAAGAGGVWWATDRGAYVYRGRWPDGIIARIDHPEGRLDGEVDAVGVSGNEVWWAGPMGVVAYDAGEGKWGEVPPVGPFSPGEATALALDEENVWIGTAGGVWRLIRETGVWHLYGEEDGLLDRRVWTITLRRNTAWFGTAKGITRFDYRLRRKSP